MSKRTTGDGKVPRAEYWITGVGQRVKVHSRALCKGRPCVVHSPSDHHMREMPTGWRGDRGISERICPCGVGHPDPDEMAYQRSLGEAGDTGIHGCCGCCCHAQ